MLDPMLVNLGAGGIIVAFVLWFWGRWLTHIERKNGNGFSAVEMIGKISSVMEYHVKRVDKQNVLLEKLISMQDEHEKDQRDHRREMREGFSKIIEKMK